MAEQQFVRLTLGGPLAGGEEWSCGMSFLVGGVPEPLDLFTWLGDVDPLVDTHLGASGGTKALMSPQSGITTARAAYYPADATDALFTAERVLVNSVGGSGSNLHPNQVACCLSMHSGFAGRRSNGRIYWPADGAAIGSTHQLDATLTIASALHLATFLGAVNNTDLGGFTVTAAIAVPGSGIPHAVTSVSADSVLDTQRRRRNKVAAVAKSTAPVV